jgi:hypothetical protein
MRTRRPKMGHYPHRIIASVVAVSAATFTLPACQEVEEPTTVLTQEQWREVRQHILDEAPTPQYKVGAIFNNEIELIGFDVTEPLEAGKPATFTWYWRALKDIGQNWEIFVHFDSAVRPYRQNLDHQPVSGLYQTGRWKKGQIIRDVQRITVRNDYPGGNAVPYVGLFRGNTRLPITNDARATDDRRAIGETLSVKAGPASTRLPEGQAQPRYTVSALPASELDGFSLDGKLDEALWNRIPVLNLRSFAAGGEFETVVRMFHTDEHLFIGARLEDTHIWATHTERDASLWNEEVFEVFIAPQGPDEPYVELQVNPLATIFDAHFLKRLGAGEGTRQEQIDRARSWNMDGLEVAVHVEGKVNDDSNPDQYWSIEMKLPFKSIPGVGNAPEQGATWRLNFYRFDRPKDVRTQAYAWATEPRTDFHRIEQFGHIIFGGPLRAEAQPVLSPEAAEQIRQKINLKVQPPTE